MPNHHKPVTLAVVVGTDCFGKSVRLRLWRRRSARSIETPFRAAGSRGDKLLLDRAFAIATPNIVEPIPQFVNLDLSGVRTFEPCLHLIEISIPDGEGRLPFSVGRSISSMPWNWECGWFQLDGQPPQPAKRSRGLAWSLMGDAGRPICSSSTGERRVAAAEPALARGFMLHVPDLRLGQLAGPLTIPARALRVPGPSHTLAEVGLAPGQRQAQLPYRHVDVLKASDDVILRPFDSTVQRGGDADDAATVAYRGWHSRYDLLSIDPDDGALHLELGAERALDPEEFAARLPLGNLPLYSIYTTRHGIEAIDLTGWRGVVREADYAHHTAWLEESRQRLSATLRKLRSGKDIRLAGYGDSLTGLGGRSPDQVEAPNGRLRDTLGYFERYGEDWKASVPLFPRKPNGAARHHRLGWNWYLKEAMEQRFGVSVDYLNWGLAGTTSAADVTTIDGFDYPNAANSDRLARLIASAPDLVTVAVGMNDIGEPISTFTNLVLMCEHIRSSGAEVIVIGLCQQNPGFNSRDHALWRHTHDQVMAAAEAARVAYVPTWRILGDGNEGATGLSAWSHSSASMTNHPGARELKAIGQLLAAIIP